jgi:NADH/NAD ratio-sensing transcriptional regulator Rex
MKQRSPDDLIILRCRIKDLKARITPNLKKKKRKHYLKKIAKIKASILKDFLTYRQNEIAKEFCPLCGKRGRHRSGYEFEHMMRCIGDCMRDDDDYIPIWLPDHKFKRCGW